MLIYSSNLLYGTGEIVGKNIEPWPKPRAAIVALTTHALIPAIRTYRTSIAINYKCKLLVFEISMKSFS